MVNIKNVVDTNVNNMNGLLKADEFTTIDKDLDDRLNNLVVSQDSLETSKLENGIYSQTFEVNEEEDAQDRSGSCSEEEHSLTEYLTSVTEIKINSLRRKNEVLEVALKKSHATIKKIESQMDEKDKEVRSYQKEIIHLKKALATKDALVKKSESKQNMSKENHHKQIQIHQNLLKDYEKLKKEIHLFQKERNSQTSLNRELQSEIESLNNKRDEDLKRKKEAEISFKERLLESENTTKQLKSDISILSSVIKKQEQLVEILQNQKLNILSAKMTKKLEEEFDDVLQPFVSGEKISGSR